jgi:hypothetical protein
MLGNSIVYVVKNNEVIAQGAVTHAKSPLGGPELFNVKVSRPSALGDLICTAKGAVYPHSDFDALDKVRCVSKALFTAGQLPAEFRQVHVPAEFTQMDRSPYEIPAADAVILLAQGLAVTDLGYDASPSAKDVLYTVQEAIDILKATGGDVTYWCRPLIVQDYDRSKTDGGIVWPGATQVIQAMLGMVMAS